MGFRLNKLVIFGVGLIGGSFALALREAGAVGEIVGVGRTAGNLAEALRLGVIDRVATDAASAVQDADLVMLAVPVGQMAAVMASISPHLSAQTVVTDAGSTKCDVVALARQHLPGHLARFVPAHPIAGAEKSGAAAASGELYRGRNVVITPMAGVDPTAVHMVRALWEAAGARVREMTPQAQKLFEVYQAASKDLGLEVKGEFSGGCADSGFTSGVGCPTICAVGPIGGNAHTPIIDASK